MTQTRVKMAHDASIAMEDIGVIVSRDSLDFIAKVRKNQKYIIFVSK